ncbi:MAG: formylmethanofuran--tetrahydromethanopterin N-formyltransferase [Gemmataceae bacterium]|nr:formylmethanofuran--tetrahydromethanopterin N-formyltransferase [Gemmataceae bacterium]
MEEGKDILTIQHQGVKILDTFAEAFTVTGARLIVTAESPGWADIAGRTATGYASSVIGCDAEAGIEKVLSSEETPDGRPGVSLLFFAFSRDSLQKALVNRVGQSILTCPTTSVFNGLAIDPGQAISLGGALRFFGDGYQTSKVVDKTRYWRIPVMDGEFLCEDKIGTVKGVAGGNILIQGETQELALEAASRAVESARQVPGVILPFPGGVVRSGSKVGSKYKKLKASTNYEYCPTLRGATNSLLEPGVSAVYEIVIDGLSLEAVTQASKAALNAACIRGVLAIGAGNYGGKLGPHHIYLRNLVDNSNS